jgi:acetyl esterase/lipase
MQLKRPLIFTILAFALLLSCSGDDSPLTDPQQEQGSNNQDPEPLPELILLNQAYGDNPQQRYDIYLPQGRTETTTKVVILVHGGGWIEGDKSDMTEYVDQLRLNHPNHAVVNMNYVLATATIPAFPNQFLDLDRLIDHLTERKTELQLLPEFGLIGASAGAHISLQYDYVYDTDDQVKFVGDIVGPTDFTDPFYSNDPNFGLLLSILVDEAAYPPGTDYAVAVSPALQVSSVSSPTIMFYGDMDPLVPLSNGITLETALSNAMITHSFTVYEGGHGDDWSQASRLDLQQQLSAFISTHLPVE